MGKRVIHLQGPQACGRGEAAVSEVGVLDQRYLSPYSSSLPRQFDFVTIKKSWTDENPRSEAARVRILNASSISLSGLYPLRGVGIISLARCISISVFLRSPLSLLRYLYDNPSCHFGIIKWRRSESTRNGRCNSKFIMPQRPWGLLPMEDVYQQ